MLRGVWLMLAGMLALAMPAAAQQKDGLQMRLQVLNGRTGKPVVHQKVQVWGSDGVPKHPGRRMVDAVSDGEGYVTLPDVVPVPQRLVISVGTFRPCSKTSVNSFEFAKVVASGVVSENACKPRISLYPQAGTLVFFVRPETWLERMRK